MQRMRRKLEPVSGGDRQFVSLLCAVRDYDLGTVDQACQQALDAGVIQAEWILNLLARATEEQATHEPIQVPQALRLNEEPAADCERYNELLSLPEVSHSIH